MTHVSNIKKRFHAHCDVISDEYITDKVHNQGEGQYKFATFLRYRTMSFNYSINTGTSVKNTEVHAETVNVITAIKLSDTDNGVVVGSDVNLLVLLSKLSHHNNA